MSNYSLWAALPKQMCFHSSARDVIPKSSRATLLHSESLGLKGRHYTCIQQMQLPGQADRLWHMTLLCLPLNQAYGICVQDILTSVSQAVLISYSWSLNDTAIPLWPRLASCIAVSCSSSVAMLSSRGLPVVWSNTVWPHDDSHQCRLFFCDTCNHVLLVVHNCLLASIQHCLS